MDPLTTTASSGSGEAATVPLRPAAAALPIIPLAWFFGLLVLLFYPVLYNMVREWILLEEMGHAFFVPVVAGYVVLNDRARILAQPVKPCWPAAFLLLWAFAQMMLGYLGADFFVARTAFLLALVGVIWTLAGTAVLRSLAFPLILLLFILRIPLFLYQQMTFPLQLLASSLATTFLESIGIPVLLNGNVIELPSQKLQVVEACSGIRSLLSLSFLSVTYAYFFDKRPWMRPALFFATIPIAIGANAVRVTITGILSEYKKEWADGFFHTFEGWLIFMVALAVLLAVHRTICHFWKPADA
jgi:exosortase